MLIIDKMPTFVDILTYIIRMITTPESFKTRYVSSFQYHVYFLLAIEISWSVELSMKTSFINARPGFLNIDFMRDE